MFSSPSVTLFLGELNSLCFVAKLTSISLVGLCLKLDGMICGDEPFRVDDVLDGLVDGAGLVGIAFDGEVFGPFTVPVRINLNSKKELIWQVMIK